MITYRYGPYEPDKDRPWDLDRLMGVLSDMIMRYDIQLEEALRMLIDRGLPVNMFLKEGGMQDLVQALEAQLREKIQSALETFELKSARKEVEEDLANSRADSQKRFKKDDELREMLEKAMADMSMDSLYRLKRHALAEGKTIRELSQLMTDLEDLTRIQTGERKHKFTGTAPLSRAEALRLLQELDDLEKLLQSLQQAAENGDLFNFNLEKLAQYLGPEQYQEFLERREQIFEKLRELLEKQGQVVQDQESGELRLSPQSIKRIGRRALEEIFATLKADTAGGLHDANEAGDSENVSSRTRPIEFGDPISNLDISSSLLNAYIRRRSRKPDFSEMEIFEARGAARSSTVVLLDMSGSMMRSDRFYNAKKVVLALDALIRQDYKDDRLMVVGFGTLAEVITPAQVPSLQPYPVTIYDPHIRLRYDLSKQSRASMERIPRYFTNLQKGLQLSRTLLGSGETRNKQIILITDGVPTAHHEGQHLHVNYPPSPADFEFALREVRNCTEDGIVINTFLLTSDWEMGYFGEEPFMRQFAKQSMGRIFYPHPGQMNRMVLVDFLQNKKAIFDY
ncbi:MAG: VWA domain-containing protein [Leptospirales bacterium]|nr:VWA domain-containing protein [Leptospirales bacterium]